MEFEERELWVPGCRKPQRSGVQPHTWLNLGSCRENRNRRQPVPQILVQPCQLPRRAQKSASISANGSDTDSLRASEQIQGTPSISTYPIVILDDGLSFPPFAHCVHDFNFAATTSLDPRH
jgi:hypothetical protein